MDATFKAEPLFFSLLQPTVLVYIYIPFTFSTRSDDMKAAKTTPLLKGILDMLATCKWSESTQISGEF